MLDGVKDAWGLLCACGGALVWAISLTVLQPLAEPGAGPASSDSYWARDARLMAILVMLGGLIIAFRGDRFLSAIGVLGAVGWLALDLSLDRIDVAGPVATVSVAVMACAAVFAAYRAGQRRGRVPNRRVLIVAGAVAAAVAPVAGSMGLTMTTGAEVGLTPARLTLGCLLTAVALGCALSAAPAPTVGRWRAAAGLAIALVASLIVLPAEPWKFELVTVFLPGSALLTGVAVIGGRPSAKRGWLRYAVLAGVMLIAYPVLLVVALGLTTFFVQLGAPLTALAGNAPPTGPDEDGLITLVGLLPGLVLGGTLLLVELTTDLPAPATPMSAEVRGAPASVRSRRGP